MVRVMSAAAIRFVILAGGGVSGFGAIAWLIKSLFAGIAADIARLVVMSDRTSDDVGQIRERVAALEARVGTGRRTIPSPR